MQPKQIFCLALLGALSIALLPTVSARDYCNRENVTIHMKACLSLSVPSDYQKGGLDDLLKGRFCGNGDLARDGMFRCQGDNADAVKNILVCGAPAIMELATSLIAADDARKPASCN